MRVIKEDVIGENADAKTPKIGVPNEVLIGNLNSGEIMEHRSTNPSNNS